MKSAPVLDFLHAARDLKRAPAFTTAAVLTLALGIAGTTVMFALIQGVLLRPLPVRDQDRIVLAWREARASGSALYPFGDREIRALGDDSQSFEATAGVARNGVARTVITENGVSSYANVGLVTGGFFDVLGVHPLLGRTLTPGDDLDGAEPVVAISHGYWRRRYGAVPDVVGRRVVLAEQSLTIVGVLPSDLDYPSGVDIWRPTTTMPTTGPFGDAARREVNLVGRLRPSVTVQQAASEIAARAQRPETAPQMRALVTVVRPFVEVVVGDVRIALQALLGAVGLVLLIASANVANLLLMRGEARRRELALRVALGAGRGRLVRQVFAESLVLSALAGLVGVAAAWWSLQAVVTLVPNGLPRVDSVRIDLAVVVFSVGIVFVTAILAGLTPAWVSPRVDLVSVLRDGGHGTSGRGSVRGRRVLVAAQVALAVTVLAAAGLLVRSVLRLQTVDLGFSAERLALLDLHLPAAKYAERARRAQFLDDVMTELESVPAILDATPVNVSPFTDRGWDVPRITAEGQTVDEAATNPSLNLESIHPNYFATFELPIVRGRAFAPADREGAPWVAIVSADLARRWWPLDTAVGKRLKMGPPDGKGTWYNVVGVAAESRYRTLGGPRPTLYLSAAQFQMSATRIVVRTTAPLDLLTTMAADRIRSADADVQLLQVAPFTQLLDAPLARPRFNALLLGVFGLAALLLSAVGLYAVMAAYVRQRDQELAVRLALGATVGTVRRLVLTEAARLAGTGAILGVAGAAITSRLLGGLLFEIEPLDPLSLAGAALLLVSAAALAVYVPVRRAARTDLLTMLKIQ